jgi:hypothetical protein
MGSRCNTCSAKECQNSANPVSAFLVNIPTTVVLAVLTNYLQSVISRAGDRKTQIRAKNNIIIIDKSTHIAVGLNGGNVSKGEFADMGKRRQAAVTEFGRALDLTSPFPEPRRPVAYGTRSSSSSSILFSASINS